VIDIHTHLHPPRLFKAIRRWFAENSTWKLTEPTEPAAVAASLRARNVERFVFCSYAHKPGMARDINAWLANTSRDLDRFGLPLATVHPADADCSLYYEEALKDGCIGLKIHEDVQNFEIDDPRLATIHELTSAHKGLVLVHVGRIPWSNDTNHGPERIKKVLQRHPDLSIVIAHLGVPDTLQYLALTREFPQLYIDTTMALSAASPLRSEVDRSVIADNVHHIVFGSDYPNLPHPYDHEVNAIDELGLPENSRQLIFVENARKLLAAHL